MNAPDPFYWRAFNILLRLLGLGATFAGLVAVITFGLGLPTLDDAPPALNWPSILSGGLVALLGLGFLMNPAFRPDMGDTRVVSNPFRALMGPRRRSWWTGDSVT